MTPRTDEQLIGAMQSGDRESLAILVQRWERPLYRFVFRMLPRPEDAHDICQETFLRVYDKAERFREGSRFSTWMYQIALNLCRDHQRKARRWSLIMSQPPGQKDDAPGEALERLPGADNPAEDAESSQWADILNRALESLPPEQREVVVLKEYEGLKFKEIANITNCPESTVKSRMYYGLKGLRSEVTRLGYSKEN